LWLPTTLAERSAQLSEAVGGWRYSGLLDRREDSQGAYPIAPIDYGIQRTRMMIKAAGTQRGPHPLVVNYRSNYGAEGYNFDEGDNPNEVITANINRVLNENTVDEKRETFIVPMRAIADLLLVKTFNY
jgi:uncharacterized protein YfaP (DUF2135 family)